MAHHLPDRVSLTRIRLFTGRKLTREEREAIVKTVNTRVYDIGIFGNDSESRDIPKNRKDPDEPWARAVTPFTMRSREPLGVDVIREVLSILEHHVPRGAGDRVRARAKPEQWTDALMIDMGDIEPDHHNSYFAPLRPITAMDRRGRRIRMNPADTIQEEFLRSPMEELFADELTAIRAVDKAQRPAGWKMSPQGVMQYILGTDEILTASGKPISPKYFGPENVVKVAIATLATDRALLLIGEPGTAKSVLSEHLAAAISDDSQMIIQGTAGTTESAIRYSWNYAMLLARGPIPEALVPSPVFRCMQAGKIVRFEEVTRCPSEVQDALISILSEKQIAVPELNGQIRATAGFNLIGTANTRDKGVNEMSSALKRRFNMVLIPLPADVETEVKIVLKRVKDIGESLKMPVSTPSEQAVERVVRIFQELRKGQTLDGKRKFKSPSGTMSTAEAISSVVGAMSLAGYFGSGQVTDADLAASIYSSVVREDPKDQGVYDEYLENVVKDRPEYAEFYRATRSVMA